MNRLKDFCPIISCWLICSVASDSFSADRLPMKISCSRVPETFGRSKIHFASQPAKVHVRCFLMVPKDDIPFDENWEFQLSELTAVVGNRDEFKIHTITIALMHFVPEKPVLDLFRGYIEAVGERLLLLKISEDLIFLELDAHGAAYRKSAENFGKADIKIDIYGMKASSCPACR